MPDRGEPIDWEALKLAVRGCRKCAIRSGCTQTVFGDGNVAAPMLFVGEAPGEAEDRRGLPFVGKAGAELRKCMEEAEIDPDQVFIANVLKCRPPEDRAPLKHEMQNCSPYLMKQIEYLKPVLIVALGAVAAQTLLVSKIPIGKLREKFHKRLHYTVLPTWHPSFVLRSRSELAHAQIVADLKAAKIFVDQMLAARKEKAEQQETETPEEGPTGTA